VGDIITREVNGTKYWYDNLHRLTREYCDPDAGSYRKEYGYEYWHGAVGRRTQVRFYNDATSTWLTQRAAYHPPLMHLARRTTAVSAQGGRFLSLSRFHGRSCCKGKRG